jgi:hypothetical protein
MLGHVISEYSRLGQVVNLRHVRSCYYRLILVRPGLFCLVQERNFSSG